MVAMVSPSLFPEGTLANHFLGGNREYALETP
jgi:hypothetical protein